jgi:hypothetical protein
MSKFLRFSVALLFLLAAGFTYAADSAANATLQFKLDFEGSNPSHYEIAVASDGHGTYTSNGELGSGASPDSAPLEFTLSETARKNLFDLAKRAKYFAGKVDSGNKKIANTGAKTLSYKDASHQTSATYNYSPNPSIQQITEIFQNLSTTLEYGRRLTWLHKYQKLALDNDLTQMQDRVRSNTLGDVEAIAPVLQAIVDDPSVMNISREKAMRLLAFASK